MKQIIALTGMPGSGKSTLAKMFEKKGYFIVHFGDVTNDMLKKECITKTESNEERIRTLLRKQYGMEAYAKLSMPKISSHDYVVIDGLYSYEEYTFLEGLFPKKVCIVALIADEKLRHNRLAVRKDRRYSKEDAALRDKAQITELNIAKTINCADFTIENTGSMGELEKKFICLIEKITNSFANKY